MNHEFYTFDIGNSHPHVGVFKDASLTEVLSWKHFLKNYKNNDKNFSGIASVVGASPDGFNELATKLIEAPKLHDQLFLEMPVSYSNTLGQDRLFQSYKVFKLALKEPKTRFALIDAGTFITMDVISNKGFEGGYIFPGASVFLSSYQRGENLTSLASQDFALQDSELPHSTNQAVVRALNLCFSSTLKEFLSLHQIKRCLITGGSSDFILTMLPKQRDFDVEVIPHLIHQSLYELADQVSHQ